MFWLLCNDIIWIMSFNLINITQLYIRKSFIKHVSLFFHWCIYIVKKILLNKIPGNSPNVVICNILTFICKNDVSIRVENPRFLQRMYSVQELACFSSHHMSASISQTVLQVSWGHYPSKMSYLLCHKFHFECNVFCGFPKNHAKSIQQLKKVIVVLKQKHPLMFHFICMDWNAPLLIHSKQVLYIADGIIQSNKLK